MAHPSASFSASVRVRIDDRPGAFARLAAAIGEAGGRLGAIDIVAASRPTKIRDVTVNCRDEAHGERSSTAIRARRGITVVNVSDRTFLMHLGGKIEVDAEGRRCKTRDDLSMAYTPGVARVCRAIADDPDEGLQPDDQAQHGGRRHRRHGRARPGRHRPGGRDAGDGGQGDAVQGVRRRGRVPDLPRHEGRRRDRATVKAIAPGFGGINLEDIAAPRCFEIEERLQRELDIPVFHDDQHGTAVVVLAALLNACKWSARRSTTSRSSPPACGAAGVGRHARSCMAAGARNIVGCDRGRRALPRPRRRT